MCRVYVLLLADCNISRLYDKRFKLVLALESTVTLSHMDSHFWGLANRTTASDDLNDTDKE